MRDRELVNLEALRGLPRVERELVQDIARHLQFVIFDPALDGAGREKRLAEIEKYLAKKLKQNKGRSVEDAAGYLRFIRNSLMHKSEVPSEVLDLGMPVFWDFLDRSVDSWEDSRLANLLSYGVGEKAILQYSDKKDMVRRYKRIFNRMPVDERRNRFGHMLLNFYTTVEFRDALKSYARREGREDVVF